MAKLCFEGDEMRYSNKLPSVSPELYMTYDNSVRRSVNFSTVPLHGSVYNFTQISDVFELSDYVADKLAVIGHEHNFGEIGIDRFRVDLFNQIHDDTHVGLLLSSVSKKRKEECFSYGMWADFISIGKAVYCALTVCFVDKDSAYEMPVSVMEFTGMNECSVQPIFIEEDAVEEYFSYFTYDDIAKISMWLGNLWCGVQYEYINRPETIKEVQQIGPISGADEDYVERESIILIRKNILVDEFGNVIKPIARNSGRKAYVEKWLVAGHDRRLRDGRVIYIAPYYKGTERNNPDVLPKTRYNRFVDDKIQEDIENR